MEVFRFRQGRSPLLVSMPHDGTHIPAELAADMTEAGLSVPDTDWHVSRLYDFLGDLDASVIQATHSRFVIDLNRPPSGAALYAGQRNTGQGENGKTQRRRRSRRVGAAAGKYRTGES